MIPQSLQEVSEITIGSLPIVDSESKRSLEVEDSRNFYANNIRMAVSIELARKDTFIDTLVALPPEFAYDFSSLWLVALLGLFGSVSSIGQKFGNSVDSNCSSSDLRHGTQSQSAL